MKVALGVCGGIAAYKAAEICRLLQERGLSVQVIMTEAAQQFVRPLTFAALTGNKVITNLWAEGPSTALASAIEHIAVAQEIGVLLIAPATADTIARLAHGLANDFLATTYLATTAAVVIAPAMNVNMWEHPATRDNVELLRGRGNVIVEPDAGYLACGMVGAGRLAENERIVEAVLAALDEGLHAAERKDLASERVLITAGGTREAIDPVRFIGNRSSGKMGFALAEAATARGARVTVIAGSITAQPAAGVELVRVESTEQMRAQVLRHLPQATMLIKAAAVADYRPRFASAQKIKRKGTGTMAIEFEPTADILAEVAQLRTAEQIVIGFAAETEDIVEHGRQKLRAKRLDAIVVNDVSRAEIGFDSDRNAVTILTEDGAQEIGKRSKRAVADAVLDCAVRLRMKTHA